MQLSTVTAVSTSVLQQAHMHTHSPLGILYITHTPSCYLGLSPTISVGLSIFLFPTHTDRYAGIKMGCNISIRISKKCFFITRFRNATLMLVEAGWVYQAEQTPRLQGPHCYWTGTSFNHKSSVIEYSSCWCRMGATIFSKIYVQHEWAALSMNCCSTSLELLFWIIQLLFTAEILLSIVLPKL